VALLVLGSGCLDVGRPRVTECIAPANAGGGWDLTCRSFGRVLSDLGYVSGTVRVINLPGAGGGIAFVNVATHRQRDSSVLIAASPSTTLNLAQGRYGSLTERDVRWVAAVGAEYGALAVQRDAPWATLDALIDDWRRDPARIIVGGGSAMASQDHMKVMLLAQSAGIDPRQVRYVPFDGGGEALTTLLGGFVQVFSGEASELSGHLRAGTIRVLAVLADHRLSDDLATVPTAREYGYDVTWVTWRGFYVPGGVSDSAYTRWVALATKAVMTPEWERARAVNRLEPFFMAGPSFEEFVYGQVESFRRISREIGLIR
jgi:putative tricarboxylic transport membrane protein